MKNPPGFTLIELSHKVAQSPRRQGSTLAFTLIELSIVLVIIGLVIGGVLVGKDLILASEIRSQISQIREFNVAARTFQTKYQCLPGDCKKAGDFGFEPRGASFGQGDGDGTITGYEANGAPRSVGGAALGGEAALFWQDLAESGLIAGPNAGVDYSSLCVDPDNYSCGTTDPFDKYLPKAKIGGGNYTHAWSGGWGDDQADGTGSGSRKQATNGTVLGSSNGINYFAIIDPELNDGELYTRSGLRVSQAYAIDSKIDDGLPQTGKTTAIFANESLQGNYSGRVQYASGGNPAAFDFGANYTVIGAHNTDATPASVDTCFDNGNVAGTQRYSMGTNQGNGVNCALSFEF